MSLEMSASATLQAPLAYESFVNDSLKTRIYTLKNGLKVYLSQNKSEPRVYANIAVRAGSKNDPSETTGLAHYLEHMMFKGTNRIATGNWEEEKLLLKQISDLYEAHRNTDDAEQKKEIYKEIDRLSGEAAKFAIPNEYDKLISTLGAKGTNAYTSNERTVYINDVPTNELERWMMVEAERFETLVLRLFHTELEIVYEEFNRSEDNDYRKSWTSIMEGLYPNHPFGQQSTLGKGEHLKNPSMENIHRFFETYYRPNNVAIILTGDLEFEPTLQLVEQYFGAWKALPIPEFTFTPEPSMSAPVIANNYGTQAAHLYLAWRGEGAGSRDAMLIELLKGILQNGQAGLFDLNLLQEQKVLQASCFEMIMTDYSSLILFGMPRQGQTLKEVKELLLTEVGKVAKGEFGDWLIEAVVNNFKYQQLKQFETNKNSGQFLVDHFIWKTDMQSMIDWYDEMAKVSKEEVMTFVQKKCNATNFVLANKHIGEDLNVHKVDKPSITPVTINRNEHSDFFEEFSLKPPLRLMPEFIDFKKAVHQEKLKGDLPFFYVENTRNETFGLYYIFDLGKNHNRHLPLALQFLPYLGTNQYSASDLKTAFFKLGVEFKVSVEEDRCHVYLTGLEKSLQEGIILFEHLLENVQPAASTLTDLTTDILKKRSDNKRNKDFLLRTALLQYAQYGEHSPLKNLFTEEELTALNPEMLTDLVHSLKKYPHRVYYYGQLPPKKVKTILNELKKTPETFTELPAKKVYKYLETNQKKVYFVDFEMKQVEIMLVGKGQQFNVDLLPEARLFNEYFGAGLSSIVFQEIREAKALAYSAYAYFAVPSSHEKPNYTLAYLGTQSDKLQEATDAMQGLLREMPQAEEQFNAAKMAALKKIESERINERTIFWRWESNQKQGINHDIREDNYERLKTFTFDDLNQFFKENIANQTFTYLVIGKKAELDLSILENLGEVIELSLEELCGF